MMVLRDCRGEEAGFPDYDWEALLYTRGNKANGYRAWYRGGVCGNCFDDGGRVHVVVDGHCLGQGELFVDFRASLPDGIYPDGSRDEVSPQPTGIELVAGKGDCGTTAEVELMLPYIKGDAFTYEDFTPEQIADLKRPATEAAGRLDDFVRTASEAEAVRADNEKSRVSAEAARERREELRVSAEEARIVDETKRREAEAERAEAEEGRRTAERERAAEFATWETEIDGKAERSELSNIVGIPAEEAIGDIEPTLVTEALRKVPQVLTPEEQAQVKTNLAISKMELFDDMWRAAVGIWGDIDHGHYEDGVNKPYYLNELWLTYEEAVQTTIYGNHFGGGQAYINTNSGMLIRTNLPPVDIVGGQVCSCKMMFLGQSKLEVARVSGFPSGTITLGGNSYAMFGTCPKLHTVLGIIDMANIAAAERNSTPFHNCPALTNVKIYKLKVSLFLGSCAAISLESLSYLVANAANTTAITITVHPDVYAKLTDESNTEWHQVLLDAAEKNITFATT